MNRASRVVISRIQNRRGLRRNLPQPLRPGELALTTDTRQVWIGNEDLPPYGIRTYDREVVLDPINEVMTDQIVSVEFDDDLTEAMYQELLVFLSRQQVLLFLPFDPALPDPARFYNQSRQVLWDGGRYVFFGLRQDELTSAELAASFPWTTDPAAAANSLFSQFVIDVSPQFPGGVPSVAATRVLAQEFSLNLVTNGLDWQGRPSSFKVLLTANPDLRARASGNAASLINLVTSEDSTQEEFVTTLGNIEIGTLDEFEEIIDLPPDNIFSDPFRFDLDPTAGATENVGFAVNGEESDTIILEYALTTPTIGTVGTLRVTNWATDEVVVFDDRVDTEPLDVTISAMASGNTVFFTYVNNTAETARFSFIVKRWRSLAP